MKKILCTDYDGTFYRNQEELKENISMSKKMMENGHKFIVVTGRSFHSFKEVLARNPMEFDYLVLCGGALIFDKSFTLLHKSLMSNFQVTSTINELVRFKSHFTNLIFVSFDGRENVYHPEQEIFKITMSVKSIEDANLISNALKDLRINVNVYIIPVPNGYLVELVDNKINKSVALNFLSHQFNFNYEDIITVGDASNDFEMVRDFKGYAIENGTDELKSVASGVVSNIQELLTIKNLI